MPQLIEIPGAGTVEFPDSMSESDILSASQRLHAQHVSPSLQPAGMTSSLFGDGEALRGPAAPRSRIEQVQEEQTRRTENFAPELEERAAAGDIINRTAALFADTGNPHAASRAETFRTESLRSIGVEPVGDQGIADVAHKPLVTLPTVSGQDLRTLGVPGKAAGILAGSQQGVIEAAQFLLTPLGIATLGSGTLPKATQQAVASAFAVDMARHLPDQFAELGTAIGEGDEERAARAITGAAATLYFVKKSAEHGAPKLANIDPLAARAKPLDQARIEQEAIRGGEPITERGSVNRSVLPESDAAGHRPALQSLDAKPTPDIAPPTVAVPDTQRSVSHSESLSRTEPVGTTSTSSAIEPAGQPRAVAESGDVQSQAGDNFQNKINSLTWEQAEVLNEAVAVEWNKNPVVRQQSEKLYADAEKLRKVKVSPAARKRNLENAEQMEMAAEGIKQQWAEEWMNNNFHLLDNPAQKSTVASPSQAETITGSNVRQGTEMPAESGASPGPQATAPGGAATGTQGAVASPVGSPASKQARRQRIVTVKQQFDKLALEYAAVHDLVRNDVVFQNAKDVHPGARATHNAEVQRLRRVMFNELGGKALDPKNAADVANLLPELQKKVKQTDDFMEAVADRNDPWSQTEVVAGELKVGDVLDVDGEPFKVTKVRPDSVELEDGRKFGKQTVKSGATLFVEGFEPKGSTPVSGVPTGETPAPPKLAPGEKGTGDLLKNQTEDFALVGERGTDAQRIAEAKAKAQADAAEAKAIQEKQQQEMIGMGGAIPAEFRNSPQTPTGIKNATVDLERQRRGLPPAMEAGHKSFGSVWDEAMARLDRAPDADEVLIASLKGKPRALTDVEDALLLHRQINLQNEYGKATRDLATAYEDSRTFPNRLEAVEELKVRTQLLSDQLLELYDVNKAAGTETGRGLAARKMMAFEDFTLAKMEMEKRAANDGRPLTDAERAEITKLQERIETTQKAFDEYREKQENERATRMTDEAIADLQRQVAQAPTYDPRIVKIAEEIVGKLEKKAKESMAFLTGASFTISPEVLYHLGVVGAAKIARGGLDFTRFSAEMIKDIGDRVKPHLQAVWDRANLHLENEGAKYGDKAPQVKNLLRKRDEGNRRENIVEGLKRAQAEGQPLSLQGDYIRKLSESFVRAGLKELDMIVDAVHGVLKEQFDPQISRRETMDAISGYGKFKPLNPNEIKATLRDIRGQLQQIAKLEDIQARKPLRKTGVERRTPSNDERRLLQQVNEAKRRYGVVVSDPARQLKSAIDAVVTRLKHSIADLEFQINTGQRIVKTRTPSPHNAETKLLEVRRDELKRQLDELLPKPELTDAQRAQMAVRVVERSIADLEARIKAGDVSRRSLRNPISTPQLDALRARREALSAELSELRKADVEWQRAQAVRELERHKVALEKSIAEKERQLKEGVSAPPGRQVNRPADPILESLMQQRDALNRDLAEARSKANAPARYAAEQQRKLAAIQKAIAERQAKLASGDFGPANRPQTSNRPMSPELEQAKQQLEAINREIAEARAASEEVALAALKRRLVTSTAEYMERLARGDFAPRQRRQIGLDTEALKLKAENEIARREHYRGLIKDRLAKRTSMEKAFDSGKEVLRLPRTAITSWDVSAPGRQGSFIVLGNPQRLAGPMKAQFQALKSERGAMMVEQEILNRPNAHLYARSKLYIAPRESLKLSAMEEAMMSRMAERIPGVAASQRAYITFLNKLRADSFDAMIAGVARKNGNLSQLELEAVANYINVATGRGSLGKTGAGAAETLATVFFSPRLVASRFQLLLMPLTGFRSGGPTSFRVRKAIAMEYAKFLSGASVIMGLALLAGATIEADPRSSDFGKLRFGNTRVDILGGLSQNTVLLSRLWTGETKSIAGDVKDLTGDVPYGQATVPDVIGRFMRTKLAPQIGTAIDLRQGQNVVGEEVTATDAAINLVVPLSFRDIHEAMKENGVPAGTALGALSLFGWGLQVYETPSAAATEYVSSAMKRVKGGTPEQRKEIRKQLLDDFLRVEKESKLESVLR